MDLLDLRNQIDQIDNELVQLFCQRMEIAAKVAEYKKAQGLPIYHPAREQEILQRVAKQAGMELGNYIRVLYSTLFELSRSYQKKIMNTCAPLSHQILDSIEHTEKQFPKKTVVACLDVEGSYSQIACEKIFQSPIIRYFNNYEAIFSAIDQGMCQYGILAIDNSTSGSVQMLHDLIIKHNYFIVRTVCMKNDHSLLVNPDTTQKDIRTVYSHEHVIKQCGDFLHGLPDDDVIPIAYNAFASEIVAKSGRKDVATPSSQSCAEQYRLTCLEATVPDKGNNHTRFICISKHMEIYPGSDKASIMMILPRRPDTLYKVLARLYALEINIAKLESYPIPDRQLELMFYFDLETSVDSKEFIQFVCELDDLCEEFKYWGNYTEVV